MAAVYLPGVVTLIPHYDIGAGHDVVNVLHFRGQPISFDTSQLTTIQTAFDQQWHGGLANLLATTSIYKGAVCIDSGSALGQEVDNTAYVPQNGTGVGNPVADNAAVLLSLHVLQRYKGGHGRVYLPGFSTSGLGSDGRTVLGSTITSLNSTWTNLVNAMRSIPSADGGPFDAVVWHKKWAAAPNTTGIITSITPQSVLASQRRRLRKVSRHKKKTP